MRNGASTSQNSLHRRLCRQVRSQNSRCRALCLGLQLSAIVVVGAAFPQRLPIGRDHQRGLNIRRRGGHFAT